MIEPMVGTLIGPHGKTVGRWVRFEVYHNLTVENLRLREGIERVKGATTEVCPDCAGCGNAHDIAIELLR